MSDYIRRSLEPVLKRAADEFPAIVLTGPRQSGKTTLLKHLFSRTHKYVSVEPSDIRASADSDPRGFLAMYSPPVILDEVQYAPALLPYIKERIDADRKKSGQYLLAGSQNLLMMERVTESLAGRVAIITDSIKAAGLSDGDYVFGDHVRTVRVRDGAPRLEDGRLAGSSLTLNRGVRNMIEMVGRSESEAVGMATMTPARVLGLEGRKGRIAGGYDADIAVFDEEWEARGTMVSGRMVYVAEPGGKMAPNRIIS